MQIQPSEICPRQTFDIELEHFARLELNVNHLFPQSTGSRNTSLQLWRLLASQSTTGMRQTVAAQVQRLLKHPGLQKVALPMGVMSFDGKSLWTSQQQQVAGLEAVANDEAGTPLWRLGTLRAVLTSVVAAPCVDLEFIGAKEGESPAFRQLLPRVVETWGEHFQVITADAGLTAAENAALVRSLGKHYLFGLKGNQPTLHGHAIESIADKRCAPRARTEDRAHGETVVREVWTHALTPGEVEFTAARLLLCVRQTHLKDNGSQSIPWRYFVTSLSTVDLSFEVAPALIKLCSSHRKLPTLDQAWAAVAGNRVEPETKSGAARDGATIAMRGLCRRLGQGPLKGD